MKADLHLVVEQCPVERKAHGVMAASVTVMLSETMFVFGISQACFFF